MDGLVKISGKLSVKGGKKEDATMANSVQNFHSLKHLEGFKASTESALVPLVSSTIFTPWGVSPPPQNGNER